MSRRALAGLLLCVPTLALGLGCKTTLSTTVKGSAKPRTQSCTPGERVEIPNGDFTITQTCLDGGNRTVGDGRGEVTSWRFDLAGDDVWSCYPESAWIDLRLRPTANLLDDELRVDGRWAMGLEEIQSLEIGREQEIQVDMMMRNGRPSPYTPSEIRRLLTEEFRGQLPMVYEANALVSWARLSIRCSR